MRILITGSREWSDVATIDRALFDALPGIPMDPRRHTVVHGGAPGADYIAGVLAEQKGMRVVVYPARWDVYGKAAGPIRNLLMAKAGADVCLAFPLGESTGTRHAMRAARMFGIPVLNYGDDYDDEDEAA